MKMIVCILACLMVVTATLEAELVDIDNDMARDSHRGDGSITDTDYGNKERNGSIFVTMTFEEVNKIVRAVSDSRNRTIQEAFDKCISYQPEQLLNATRVCLQILNINVTAGNNSALYDRFAVEPEIIPELAECVRQKTTPFNPAEVAGMTEFENCIRKLYQDYFTNTTTTTTTTPPAQ